MPSYTRDSSALRFWYPLGSPRILRDNCIRYLRTGNLIYNWLGALCLFWDSSFIVKIRVVTYFFWYTWRKSCDGVLVYNWFLVDVLFSNSRKKSGERGGTGMIGFLSWWSSDEGIRSTSSKVGITLPEGGAAAVNSSTPPLQPQGGYTTQCWVLWFA
jgi:hypothetical protein